MATTIHEIPHEDPSFQAFLDERERQRATALEQYRRIDKLIRERLAALNAQEQALYKEMASSASSLGDRFRARAAAKKQRRANEQEIERTLGAEMRLIASTWHLSDPGGALRQSFDDYGYAVAQSQDSDRLDPVLVAIPSTRVREENGWKIYSKRNALFGTTELARVLGNTIAVPRSNEDSVRAAILLAKDRCLPPLQFKGTDTFVALARRIAAELGLAEGSVQNTVTGVDRDGAQQQGGVTTSATPAEPKKKSGAAASQDLLSQKSAAAADLGVTLRSEISWVDVKARLMQEPRREFILLARNDETIILLDKETGDTMRAGVGRFADPEHIVAGVPFRLHEDANGLLAFGESGVSRMSAPGEASVPASATGHEEEPVDRDDVGSAMVQEDALRASFASMLDGRPMCDGRDLPAGSEIEGTATGEATVEGQRFGLVDTGAMLVATPLGNDQPFEGAVVVEIAEDGAVTVRPNERGVTPAQADVSATRGKSRGGR